MSKNNSFSITYIVLVLIIVTFSLIGGIFVDEDSAIKTLEARGYSDIEIIDQSWFLVGTRGCSADDAAKFTAKAVNPAGQSVEIYVCSGFLFKGGTVRTN